jgi:hypothetical protein
MRSLIVRYRAIQNSLSGIAALLGTKVSAGRRFDPSPAQGRPPRIRIRAFSPEDMAECREIYRLNEPNRFPAGFLGEFENSTALPNCSFVVACAENSIIGVAGIVIPQSATFQNVSLLFGMVRPEMHRKGVGSALLLSRLCILPPPDPYWRLTLAPVGDSWVYYSRFGFQFYGRMRSAGPLFNVYQAMLYRPEWDRCRKILDEAGVSGIEDLIDSRLARESLAAAARVGDGPV